MQINFLNYLSCTAVAEGTAYAPGTGPQPVTFYIRTLHGASSPSSPLARVSLTDDAAVKEPGDIGAAFHLRQSRRGVLSGKLELTPYPRPGPHSTSLPTGRSGFCLLQGTPDPTHKVHAVFSQPVKTLEEEEEGEECNKARAEVVPKDSEGQTSLSDSIPGTF